MLAKSRSSILRYCVAMVAGFVVKILWNNSLILSLDQYQFALTLVKLYLLWIELKILIGSLSSTNFAIRTAKMDSCTSLFGPYWRIMVSFFYCRFMELSSYGSVHKPAKVRSTVLQYEPHACSITYQLYSTRWIFAKIRLSNNYRLLWFDPHVFKSITKTIFYEGHGYLKFIFIDIILTRKCGLPGMLHFSGMRNRLAAKGT